MTQKAFLLILFFAVLGDRASAVEFIGISDTWFVESGKSFFVTGVNNHYVTFGTQVEVTRVLDDAVALGVNTVRIFLQPVIGSLDGSTTVVWDWTSKASSSDLGVNGRYLLYWNNRAGKMEINDGPDGMEKVDWLIAEAKKRNLRLIICFLDSWAYTGGAQQISAWYRSGATAVWPEIRGMDYHFFYADQRTKADYKIWVRHVLERVNPRTKLQYRMDPTIMAWELMNEPNVDEPALRHTWTAEMSAYVKAIDHNHPVGSGSANIKNDELIQDLKIPSIDFGTWHGYSDYMEKTPAEFDELIPRYCSTAARYRKPILLEEFGYQRSHQDQAEAYKRWLTTLTNDHNCAGWVLWRLVSRQQDGRYPVDEHDQFDVQNDGGPTWNALKQAVKLGETRK